MLAVLIVNLVIIVDQLTKWWAANVLQHMHDGKIPLIDGVLSFTYATNDGMAFGLLGDHRWVFILLTCLVLAVIIGFFVATRKRNRHPFLDVSLGLVLAGGAANMIDRTFFGTESLFSGSVVDFIYFELIDFPIFNVADISVCVGMGLFVLYMLVIEGRIDPKKYVTFFREEKKQPKNQCSCSCIDDKHEHNESEN